MPTQSSSRKIWIIVLSLVVVAGVAVGAFLYLKPKAATAISPTTVAGTGAPGASSSNVTVSVLGSSGSAGSSASAGSSSAAAVDPPVTVPTSKIKPVPTNAGKTPTAAGVLKRISSLLASPALGKLEGEIIDPTSGAVLWKQNPSNPALPASTQKLLTGAALLTQVGPNSYFATKIVQGTTPGDIVFVGGGDVTLSARNAGVSTVYDGAPTVADLAAQVVTSGVKVKRIILDTSYWSGPELAEGWDPSDIAGTSNAPEGYITRMQALMVDGDRLDPSNEDSPRTGQPAMTAGKALAKALGNTALPIVTGVAPRNAKLLAVVHSQPMSVLLAQALLNSDNILAEALARQVAIRMGAQPSFQGVAAAIPVALQNLGISTTGVTLNDGSGLSTEDMVPPATLAQVMSLAVSGKVPALQTLLTGLPVAGVSGTLADRYKSPDSKAGAGWVRAKTGSVQVTYALVGYVPDIDGRVLVFAINSNDVNAKTTRDAQDAVAAALRGCGCS